MHHAIGLSLFVLILQREPTSPAKFDRLPEIPTDVLADTVLCNLKRKLLYSVIRMAMSVN